jgi:phosphohistidine phosphatase
MKRTLILVRHAKSSWNESGLPDMKRPLNERGERDAPFMAKRMAARGIQIDKIVSSPAVRAHTTAKAYASALGFSEGDIEVVDAVYEASVAKLMDVINGFNNDWKVVLIFGHNPGFSYLLQYLCGQMLHMPTNGVATLEVEADSWEYFGTGCATLVDYDFPKKHLAPL